MSKPRILENGPNCKHFTATTVEQLPLTPGTADKLKYSDLFLTRPKSYIAYRLSDFAKGHEIIMNICLFGKVKCNKESYFCLIKDKDNQFNRFSSTLICSKSAYLIKKAYIGPL